VGPYETLGGWVMESRGDLPEAGSTWVEEGLEVRVEAVSTTRIDLVSLRRLGKDAEE
jgi:CBS domain containing-hemolysin-like protein